MSMLWGSQFHKETRSKAHIEYKWETSKFLVEKSQGHLRRYRKFTKFHISSMIKALKATHIRNRRSGEWARVLSIAKE